MNVEVEDLYDEFGNYIGPNQSDSDSDSLELPEVPSKPTDLNPPSTTPANQNSHEQDDSHQAETSPPIDETALIVLPEDKIHYRSAEDVFGPDTEVLVEEEDAQLISEPIIAPVVEPSSGLNEKEGSAPPCKYDQAYLTNAILPCAQLLRNIAFVGHLHHGKTSLIDMLFDATHDMPWDGLDDRDFPVRYCDTRHDEQELHISVKTTASTFLLQNFMEKSFGVTVLDSPGHVNFLDEAVAAMNLVDGVVVVVDVAEGVMMGTEELLRRAASMRLDIVLVISKIDRLCLELRLPPLDAYHKIRHVIESVNEVLEPYNVPLLSPARGNVAFASSTECICFTLLQFAHEYIRKHGGAERFPMNAETLARRFWGDVYYDEESRKFTKNNTGNAKRTFITFILEPYYKLHTSVLSEDVDDLTMLFRRHNMLATKKDRSEDNCNGFIDEKKLSSDLKAILKEVNSQSFAMGTMCGFTEMIVKHIKPPNEASEKKIEIMVGNKMQEADDSATDQSRWLSAARNCDSGKESPVVAYVGKLSPDERGEHFDCLVRILSGTITAGDEVRILGNGYNLVTNSDDESMGRVAGIYVPCARFKLKVNEASAGQVVLLRGIDNTVFKSATIVSSNDELSRHAFPLCPVQDYLPPSVVKVAVEPVRPSELPKMVSALRKCVNSYPGLVTKVEETGEHALMGSGELYMDCVLRDLRESYGEVEVKVSDPVVPFEETVSDTSAILCYGDTPNGQNKLTMTAEPLEESIMKALEDGTLARRGNSIPTLRDYGWDALAAKSLLTFGPDTSRGPNALLNDVLGQDERKMVDDVRDSIVQGFSWAMRAGPLADEPVRGVKVFLSNASIAKERTGRTPAQLIPTCRRVAYSAILTAKPRLMEPVFITEIICPIQTVNVAHTLVGRRRGHIFSERDVAGTPLKRIMAYMPVLDSYGFEPDLRNLTHGAAFCLQMFDHWGTVPGDPLDRSVELRPLEPAGRYELARECMVKTRRRKGMPDEVSITKYFDDPLLVEMATENEALRQLL